MQLPDDVRLLIEAVQPFKAVTGVCADRSWNMGQALLILNDWARIDRHRRLHLIGTTPTNGGIRFDLPEGMTLEFCHVDCGAILEHNSEIAQFKIEKYVRGKEIGANPNFTFDITVDETPRCYRQDISIGMILSVQAVIERFEQHFGIVPPPD